MYSSKHCTMCFLGLLKYTHFCPPFLALNRLKKIRPARCCHLISFQLTFGVSISLNPFAPEQNGLRKANVFGVQISKCSLAIIVCNKQYNYQSEIINN